MKRILFLSADPFVNAKQRLFLDREQRSIEERLRSASLREQFELHFQPAVRPIDFSGALLRYLPKIVQFSGHGDRTGMIYAEGEAGMATPMSPHAVANLFREFADQVECVILNACFAEVQALAIGRYIPFVVGMRAEIHDEDAIAFSTGFYQALGEGCDIEKAFRMACNYIDLEHLPDSMVPVLIKGGSPVSKP